MLFFPFLPLPSPSFPFISSLPLSPLPFREWLGCRGPNGLCWFDALRRRLAGGFWRGIFQYPAPLGATLPQFKAMTSSPSPLRRSVTIYVRPPSSSSSPSSLVSAAFSSTSVVPPLKQGGKERLFAISHSGGLLLQASPDSPSLSHLHTSSSPRPFAHVPPAARLLCHRGHGRPSHRVHPNIYVSGLSYSPSETSARRW